MCCYKCLALSTGGCELLAFSYKTLYCKRLIFPGLNISPFRSKFKFWNNLRVLIFATQWDLIIDSNVFTFHQNCSQDPFFANCRRFVEFAKIRSLRKLSRLQYMDSLKHFRDYYLKMFEVYFFFKCSFRINLI
uniref:Putative homeobox transcription factor sip1 n=1 Tax=Ixodes ricinus TaxID=34613 RepID=A0A6B0US49_IXORI